MSLKRQKVSSVECRLLRSVRLDTRHSTLSTSPAFTLLELMIVVAIMGIILAMGIPMVYQLRHEAPLRKAVRDVIEVCSQARALAILQSKAVPVIFHPREHRLEIQGAGHSKEAGTGQVQVGLTPGAGSGTSVKISDDVA